MAAAPPAVVTTPVNTPKLSRPRSWSNASGSDDPDPERSPGASPEHPKRPASVVPCEAAEAPLDPTIEKEVASFYEKKGMVPALEATAKAPSVAVTDVAAQAAAIAPRSKTATSPFLRLVRMLLSIFRQPGV